MICPACNQETEEGKFCTKCGSPLNQPNKPAAGETSKENTSEIHTEASQQENASTAETNSETAQTFNATFDKVKTGSNQYWNYFITRMKNPNIAFKDNEQQLINSIITAIILTLAATLFCYGLINSLFNDAMAAASFSDESLGDYLPVFSTILKGMLIFIVLFFVGLIANFITFKLAKHPLSFAEQFTRFTGTLVPFTGFFVVIAILSLLGIAKINVMELGLWMLQLEGGSSGNFPWGLAFGMFIVTVLFTFIIYINPVIHMLYALIQEKSKQSFYFTVISLAITIAIITILQHFFILDILIGIMESIEYMGVF